MSTLNNIIKVTKEQYDKLRKGERVNGHAYDESALYLVEDNTEYASKSDIDTSLNEIRSSINATDQDVATLNEKLTEYDDEFKSLGDKYANKSHSHEVSDIKSTSADLDGNGFHVIVSEGHDTTTKWVDLADSDTYPLPYAKKSLETDVSNLSDKVNNVEVSLENKASIDSLVGLMGEIGELSDKVDKVDTQTNINTTDIAALKEKVITGDSHPDTFLSFLCNDTSPYFVQVDGHGMAMRSVTIDISQKSNWGVYYEYFRSTVFNMHSGSPDDLTKPHTVTGLFIKGPFNTGFLTSNLQTLFNLSGGPTYDNLDSFKVEALGGKESVAECTIKITAYTKDARTYELQMSCITYDGVRQYQSNGWYCVTEQIEKILEKIEYGSFTLQANSSDDEATDNTVFYFDNMDYFKLVFKNHSNGVNSIEIEIPSSKGQEYEYADLEGDEINGCSVEYINGLLVIVNSTGNIKYCDTIDSWDGISIYAASNSSSGAATFYYKIERWNI